MKAKISKPSRSQAFSWPTTNGGEAIWQNHGGQNHEVGIRRDESTNVGAGHVRNSQTASCARSIDVKTILAALVRTSLPHSCHAEQLKTNRNHRRAAHIAPTRGRETVPLPHLKCWSLGDVQAMRTDAIRLLADQLRSDRFGNDGGPVGIEAGCSASHAGFGKFGVQRNARRQRFGSPSDLGVKVRLQQASC